MIFQLVVFVGTFLCLVNADIPDVRPKPTKRTFSSEKIDNLIDTLVPLFKNKDLGTLFNNCLPNTLDTTITYSGQFYGGDELDAFVITGDIDAMWLRDSTNQVIPFIPYVAQDEGLNSLIIGLINRQARSVIIDPFANAFNFNASRAGHQSDIRTPKMTAAVFEGKYEIDSLCAFLKLSYWYWRSASDAIPTFLTDTWMKAIESTLATISTMQKDDGKSKMPPYLFQRLTTTASDTLAMDGRGPPVAVINGLSRSLFRPSDDAVTFSYNIPGNAFACAELNHLSQLLAAIKADPRGAKYGEKVDAIASSTASMSKSICGALDAIIAETASKGATASLPYEVDGGTSQYFMDDANVPSLLSLPVLGYMSPSHPVYASTRGFVMSERNPFWFSGAAGEGVGGPHVGFGYAWPMSIVTRAMTSQDDEEIKTCLDMLLTSSAGTGFMHESFNVDNAADYTRSWFAWANGLFGELVLQLVKEKPHLILDGDAATIEKARGSVQAPICQLAQQEALL